MAQGTARRRTRATLSFVAVGMALLGVAAQARAAADSYTGTIIGTPGLVDYYRFGEPSGTTAIDSFGSNNGTYKTGTTLGAAGAITDGTKAASFNGSGGSMALSSTTTNGFTGTSQFSLEAWIKPSAIPSSDYSRIFSKELDAANTSGYYMWLYPTSDPNHGKVGFERSDGSGGFDVVASSTVLTAGNWYHVVGTYNGSTLTIYVNGTATSNPASHSLPAVAKPFEIGADSTCDCVTFPGAIDEAAVYNTPLSATTVTAHYNAGRSLGSYADAVLGTANLKSYWRLGESTGNVADSKGTITGTPHGTITRAVRGALAGDNNLAARFGTNGYVGFGDNYGFTGTAKFSYESWVKLTSIPTEYSRLASKELDDTNTRGWFVFVYPSGAGANAGKVGFVRADGQAGSGHKVELASGSALVPGRWAHVVATYDGATMKLYIDNGAPTSAASTSSIPAITQPLDIGADSHCDCTSLPAALDDVAIYDNALTAAQIDTHYKARKAFTWGMDAGTHYYTNPGSDPDPAIAAAHATSIREDFDAYTIPTASTTPTLAQDDAVFLGAAQNHIDVMALFNASHLPANQADYTAAGNVAKFFVARYGPHGSIWSGANAAFKPWAMRYIDLWNEPYYGTPGWRTEYNPEGYADYVRSVYNAAKSTDPDVDYLLEAEQVGSDTSGNTDPNFLARMWTQRPDLADHFDAISLHPYTQDWQADPTLSPDCPAGNNYCFKRIGTIKTMIDSHLGGGSKRDIITENGWTTCTLPNHDCVSETNQKNYTLNVVGQLDSTYTYVDGYYTYHWGDTDSDPTVPFGNFGLHFNNGNPKQVFTPFSAAMALDP